MPFKSRFHRYHPALVGRARDLRSAMTSAERHLWYDFLRLQKPRWLKQRPIGSFIVDFYCAKLKLVIEIDGETHMNPEAERYDAERTSRLNELGIRVVRFTNAEVLEDFPGTCEKIENLMKNDPS